VKGSSTRGPVALVAIAVLLLGIIVGTAQADLSVCTQHSANPAYFSPNGDKVQDATTISYTLAESAHVKLTILNSASATVRTLVSANRAASSVPYRVVFNGRDQSGRALPNGVYRYSLVCRNAKGTQTVSGRIVIDRIRPVLYGLGMSPGVFWPNGDGYRDVTSVKYRLSQTTLVGLRATTYSGKTVRYFSSVWQQPGTFARGWDGKNGSGTPLGFGSYRMIVSSRDLAGNSSRTTLGVYISPFSDIIREPATFRSHILSLINHKALSISGDGWFTGRADGTFAPSSYMRRGDLAVSLVKAFGWQNETASIAFSDLPTSSPLHKYAALAVEHGVMGYQNSTTKEFGAATPISAATAMIGIVKGMGLSSLAANIRAQDTATPSRNGYMVVAGNLGLRYSYTRIFPSRAYNRREMSLSLDKMLHLPAWKIDRMKALFGPAAAQPIVQTAKQKAVTNASRQLIGYPYVWGGESFSEGGFDCSGFVYYVFRTRLGYSIQRTSAAAGADNRYPRITRVSALRPADTVYFRAAGGNYINHTGIYLGNGYFIHSTRSRGGVSIDRFDPVNDSYWVEQFAGGRRIVR